MIKLLRNQYQRYENLPSQLFNNPIIHLILLIPVITAKFINHNNTGTSCLRNFGGRQRAKGRYYKKPSRKDLYTKFY